MRTLRIIFIVVFILILLAFTMGCKQQRNKQYVDNAERVFMHTPTWFSFIRNGKIITVTLNSPAQFQYDLKDEEKIWGQEEEMTNAYIYIIHLHSPTEISGGC